MIKFENTEVLGFEHAIRGMRNPKNSWDKSDSLFIPFEYCDDVEELDMAGFCHNEFPKIGPNDLNLMKCLINAGPVHRKFMRMIVVYVDITAPLYWWKEFDTYKVGTVSNSCSTMHKIQAKEFTLDDFSREHLALDGLILLNKTIDALNAFRNMYNNYDNLELGTELTKKDCWWQMIQLLPSSYNQKRTVMLNYEVLANIYQLDCRRHHKLDEWALHEDCSYFGFCDWIKTLPYSELITGGYKEND